MTERSTTVHATGWLGFQKWARLRLLHHFLPIVHPNIRIPILNTFTLISNKTSMFNCISDSTWSLGWFSLFNLLTWLPIWRCSSHFLKLFKSIFLIQFCFIWPLFCNCSRRRCVFGGFLWLHTSQNTFVLPGEHLDKFWKKIFKVRKHFFGKHAICVTLMLLYQHSKSNNILLLLNLVQIYKFLVASRLEFSIHIKNVSNSTTHSCRKISTSVSKDNYYPTSHILASMISNAFNYRLSPRITHTKSFCGHPIEICLTTCSSIECHITNYNISLWVKGTLLWRIYYNLAARQPFTNIIIAIAFKFQSDTRTKECTKALACASCKSDMNGVIWKTI